MPAFGHYWVWIIGAIALWVGMLRLFLSRRLAESQQRRQMQTRRLAKLMAFAFLMAVPGYALLWWLNRTGPVSWVFVTIIFLLLSAVDYSLRTRELSLEKGVLQNRCFGVLYLGFSLAACVAALRS